ncbi:hypothetical protein Patl1_30008 [Pistacia atlantica]|uniref:Uncharacterized protein n=1 Tax=Pistacia atlantica TaxID=434234 RepID=A0ACC1ADU1_9ROSI|nr:hypothetical protein Patl1_30008 [Pistacia atlantica]
MFCVFLNKIDGALLGGIEVLKALLSKGLTVSARHFKTQQKYKHIRLQLCRLELSVLSSINHEGSSELIQLPIGRISCVSKEGYCNLILMPAGRFWCDCEAAMWEDVYVQELHVLQIEVTGAQLRMFVGADFESDVVCRPLFVNLELAVECFGFVFFDRSGSPLQAAGLGGFEGFAVEGGSGVSSRQSLPWGVEVQQVLAGLVGTNIFSAAAFCCYSGVLACW